MTSSTLRAAGSFLNTTSMSSRRRLNISQPSISIFFAAYVPLKKRLYVERHRDAFSKRGSTLFHNTFSNELEKVLHSTSVNGDTRFCLLPIVSTKGSEVHFKMVFHEPLAARGGSLWMKWSTFTSPRHRFHFFYLYTQVDYICSFKNARSLEMTFSFPNKEIVTGSSGPFVWPVVTTRIGINKRFPFCPVFFWTAFVACFTAS